MEFGNISLNSSSHWIMTKLWKKTLPNPNGRFSLPFRESFLNVRGFFTNPHWFLSTSSWVPCGEEVWHSWGGREFWHSKCLLPLPFSLIKPLCTQLPLHAALRKAQFLNELIVYYLFLYLYCFYCLDIVVGEPTLFQLFDFL